MDITNILNEDKDMNGKLKVENIFKVRKAVQSLGYTPEMIADASMRYQLDNPLLYDILKLPILDRTEITKKPKTNIETLDLILQEIKGKIKEDNHFNICYILIEKLKKLSHLNKILSTYILGIRKHLIHGRLHTDYLIHGTVTGRLSSANPNLQNIPGESIQDNYGKEIKRMFVPNEGNFLIQYDGS